VTPRSYCYFGSDEFTGDFRTFGKTPGVHIGLNYDAGFDDKGRVLTSPPSPGGISGGGAWLVPDFSAPDLIFLEGIFIECHRQKYAFSRRIDLVVKFIRRHVAPPRQA
jgi:hypothetical protein